MVRLSSAINTFPLLASLASGKVLLGESRQWTTEEYESGEVHMAVMNRKLDTWAAAEANGIMNSTRYPELGFAKCINGFVEAIPGDRANTFRCQNIDLYHFLSHSALGDPSSEGSSSWGWTSADGREFAAIGSFHGTAFVEITPAGKMLFLGRLDAHTIGSIWHEIRTIGDYVIVGSEARLHGIQVFDMKKLLTVDPATPQSWGFTDLTSWTTALLPLGRAHNVVINHEKNYIAAVGAQPRSDPICRSGMVFYDFSDPTKLTTLGCAAGDGYTHDAECLVYRGPDSRYVGRDICYAYNEDTVTILDVTDKANVTNIISKFTYPGARYIHQGAVLDVNNQEYLVLDDEVDELEKSGIAANGYAVTYIADIRDLQNPKIVGHYQMKHAAIDHNQYIVNGLDYQSSYGAGLRVFDVSSIPRDPSGASVCEAAFFDVYPEDDLLPGGGQIEFMGTWSSYANFKSGYIFINTIERGAFVVKMTSRSCLPAPVCNADDCLRAMRAPRRLAESENVCRTVLNMPTPVASSLPKYATDACRGNVVSKVKSACACLPTPTGNFA